MRPVQELCHRLPSHLAGIRMRDGERFYRTDSGVVLVTAEALKRQSAAAR